MTLRLPSTGVLMHREGTAPINQFQVLGERGSGTNYVRKTLEMNLDIMRVDGLGWKHGFPHMVAIPRDLLVVCVVRDARAWARSMHKRPWHGHPSLQALAFSDFIRAEWIGIVDRASHFEMLSDELDALGAELQHDRHPITGARFPNLFALRRAKLEALLGLANRGCSYVFLRAEAFIDAPETLTRQIGDAFSLSWKPPRFKTVKRRLGNRFKRATEAGDTPETLSDDDLAFLKSQLDLTAEEALGYTY